MNSFNSKYPYLPRLILLLIFVWGILTIRLDAPWFGHHDENGRWISTAVRNYALYGAAHLKYLVTVTASPSSQENLEVYINHPPLIVWFVNLAADVFGRYHNHPLIVTGSPYESSARFVPIAATLVSICAFYIMVRRLFGLRLAWLASLLYSLTPMTLYFGRMVNHEALALLWLYLFGAIFVKWMKCYSHRGSIALLICGGLAIWTAWASCFFLLMLVIVALIYGQRAQRKGIFSIVIALGGITALLLLYYILAYPDTLNALQSAFAYRSSNVNLRRGSAAFTLTEFIIRQLTHGLTTISFGVFILGFVGIGLLIKQRPLAFTNAFVLALAAAAGCYMAVFRNPFYIHDYYQIYFMPSFAIAAALALDSAKQVKRRGLKRYAYPVALSLVLVSWAAGLWWLTILHLSGTDTFPREVVMGLAENTAQNDLIATNLVEVTGAFEYYAYRRILANQSLESANTLENPLGTVWYLDCATTEANEGFAEDTLQVADICHLVKLKE